MRIAVIGSGISGNSAASVLSEKHDVILYEKRERTGGHSATVDIDYDGTPISVDTGFIVYNELNYPNLTKMFAHLGVETEESDMSFALSADNRRHEWSGQSLNTVFAQRRNLMSPSFLMMLRQIFRFNKESVRDLDAGLLRGLSLGNYLNANRYGRTFTDRYLLPMGAAIWSTPLADMADYPAENFVSFFKNHRLVNFDRPIWRTVSGGSRQYVGKLLAPLGDNIRHGAMVTGVERFPDRVVVTDVNGGSDTFDHVVIAGHSDQALAMLTTPSQDEHAILSAIRYRPNTVYLHRDLSLMPRNRKVWASWNYLAGQDAFTQAQVTVSYWMNRLQNIPEDKPLFVTLNPVEAPSEELTFGRFVYDHPQFNQAAIDAQTALDTIQGRQRTWFCGAWTGHGFHEDGLKSGLAVARALGCEAPWEQSRDKELALQAAE
ncbi:NAD(P)/FAD-dependent oxidoreductase [Roseibium limicola]|uniref:FAD-dependent oxidoreductase n=1 Tax=Roseibium limicola TaxID=2816037 RepID=A0A939EL32_9HYPH|nr:FAD-dependent oxidoreductase [Roseibium limicola]MBO0344606.1 FAD-dependent oxidoreductase [Roseibium limicola]